MAESETNRGVAATAAPVQQGLRLRGAKWRVGPAVIGLMVAAVIVVAALAIGARSGWETIGSSGINRSLLPKIGAVARDFATEDGYGNPV